MAGPELSTTLLWCRVLSLYKHLSTMIKHKELLVKSTIWHLFLDSINSEIFTFSSSSRKSDYTYAMYAGRCGYYGVKRAFLINSMIQRTLETMKMLLGMHSTTLCTDLSVMTANDMMTDINVDLDEAEDICDASNEYGDVMQPDNGDDWLLEDLHEQNLHEIGSPGVFLRPPHYRNFYEEQPEPSLPVVKQEEISERKSSKLSFSDFFSISAVGQKVESRINWSNKEHEMKKDKSTKGTILSDNDLGKPNVTLQKSGQFKGKVISVNDFVEPEINPKKAKDSKRKDSKKKKEVALDNLDEGSLNISVLKDVFTGVITIREAHFAMQKVWGHNFASACPTDYRT
ncbi:hypothetical protein C8R45DRAFT_1217364 [Mycena sanguinolenta]|nr:hypothetical protein C8R45DRAFT_1217364 [Mycena sanguinolenta]